MNAYQVKVRTADTCVRFPAIATSTPAAIDAAFVAFGDLALGVTATPFHPHRKDDTMPRAKAQPKEQPDQVSLEIAYRKMMTPLSYECVLKSRKLKHLLVRLALQHMRSRDRFDIKKLQANDHDD